MIEELKALDHERMLADLLAVIHRDGGHRQDEIGTEQAWMEAMMLVPTYLSALEAVPVMKEALESGLSLIDDYCRPSIGVRNLKGLATWADEWADNTRQALAALEGK